MACKSHPLYRFICHYQSFELLLEWYSVEYCKRVYYIAFLSFIKYVCFKTTSSLLYLCYTVSLQLETA